MIGVYRLEPRSIRRALRHSLTTDVVLVNLESGIQIRECTKDLDLFGCDVSSATHFPAGNKVMPKIAHGRAPPIKAPSLPIVTHDDFSCLPVLDFTSTGFCL
jgi:hypothetical protein